MSRRLSRRSFLGAATAASVVAVPGGRVTAAFGQDSPPERVDCDVAVLGLTLSGLVAARELERRWRVVVIDNGHEPGALDPWLTPRHERLWSLAHSLGLRVEPLESGGSAMDGGELTATPLSASALSAGGRSDAELASAFHKLDRMASELDLTEPWSAVNAGVRDARTLASWLDDSLVSDQARRRMHQGFELAMGASTHEISLLFALAVVQSAGGARSLLQAAYFPEARIDGNLIGALSESLAEKPRRVEGATVHSDRRGASIQGGTLQVSARRLVLSRAPGSRPGPAFAPGVRASVVCTYRSAPWRGAHLSGRVLGDGQPVHAVHAAEDGRTLVSVIAGDPARRWQRLDAVARRDRVTASLGRWLGDKARQPVRYEEASTACAARVVGAPGALTAAEDELRLPQGVVFSAASETATAWIGHAEGLVEVGQRVAADVASSLGRHGVGV